MLELPLQLMDAEANKIVLHFVNERLLAIMRSIILDEVISYMDTAESFDYKAAMDNFDELVDIESLIYDMDFAKNISLMFLPEHYPINKANYNFLGLYKLLKAKKEYIPELAMEYVLYRIIDEQVEGLAILKEASLEEILEVCPDFNAEDAETYTNTITMPEPYRTTVLNAIQKENPDFSEDEIEETINLFEDISEYGKTCFWDYDFLLLERFTEDELRNSDINAMMGIIDKAPSNKIKIPLRDKNGKRINVKTEYHINPWDLEE